MDSLDAEVLTEFLVESLEGLDQFDRDLLALERDPNDESSIASAFRTIHTIKGTCGFLGFERLEAVAHAGENLLSQLRDGSRRIDAAIADALLALTDTVREILARIGADGHEGDANHGALVARLEALTTAPAVAHIDPHEPHEHAAPERLGDALVADGHATPADVALGLIQQDAGDPRRLGEILVEQGVVEPPQVREALEQQLEQRGGVTSDSTIRVDVGLLDDLMNLVGELVLTRNQIVQWGGAHDVDSTFVSTSQRLNLVTTDLQARMMKTRMQPIGAVFGRFPRVVRDLASKCGKQVEVVMEGLDTELDRSVIEAIRDPLTHLVRNAVDHGIEEPEKRRGQGKPAQGQLRLRAFHEGGKVNIEIADDGGGISVESVKAVAVQRGVVSAAAAEGMRDREAIELIFQPGFSTASSVTSVSGRGVGMDVVKTNVEAIGGTIDVQTVPGSGTVFRIKIPLTLAIIPALVVTTAGDQFAIPQMNLLELVRLEPGGDARVESVQGVPVYRLRGEILPIISLRNELLLTDETSGVQDASSFDQSSAVNIVVLRAESQQFGVVVDEINDTEEIVVKPLAPQLDSIEVYSGCTIMGDGRVALILDVHGLAQRVGMLTGGGRAETQRVDDSEAAGNLSAEEDHLLVVQIGDTGRAAIPLALVHRLEEIDASTIEWSAERDVVQYRGGIMPLVPVARVLGRPDTDATDAALQVVVYEHDGDSVGLVVRRVLDIVSDIRRDGADRPDGVVARSTVLNGAVTDVLNVRTIVDKAWSEVSVAS